jgi:hypothetical protein
MEIKYAPWTRLMVFGAKIYKSLDSNSDSLADESPRTKEYYSARLKSIIGFCHGKIFDQVEKSKKLSTSGANSTISPKQFLDFPILI